MIGLLSLFPDKVKEAGEQYAPSIIAQYVYDLSKEYSRFYTVHSIFNADTEDERNFRVALSAQVGKTIRTSMGLLGIQVPERM